MVLTIFEKAAVAVGVVALGTAGYYAWRRFQGAEAREEAPRTGTRMTPCTRAEMRAGTCVGVRKGTWENRCRPDEVRRGTCVGPDIYQTKPTVFKSQTARVARRVERAVPGVRLTRTAVITDESGADQAVVEVIKPTTGRQTEAVMRHIVAPTTATTRPGGGGAGRRV